MGNFPMTVYGKAGSAQYPNQPDYAWYAGFVIHHDRQADRRHRRRRTGRVR